MQKRIQQLRSDYEKAEETSKKYKVINEQLRNKIRKMKVYILLLYNQNDYDELFLAANQNNKIPDANKLNRKTIKILADNNQHYKDIIQVYINININI